VIADMWESFTWALNTIFAWVFDWTRTWWETSPLSLLGVVITVVVAFVVTFRRAE